MNTFAISAGADAATRGRDLVELEFEATFVHSLPGDADSRPVSRQVPGVSWSPVRPTPVAAPRLLAWSDDVGALLGIARPQDPDGAATQVLAGNRVLPTMQPYAARYGGHQFGNWAGQLGDGRAITLGEVVRDGARWELQLKGAGRTAYSRFADGRAVLRSSLREFLCSEAMHHLGVPTTRALSLVATGDTVVRDMFYDGNPQGEPGAIVCRVAPTFVRFGNFEIHAAFEEREPQAALARWVIEQHYPQFAPALRGDAASASRAYVDWFHEICRRTAVTIAHWMRVGFVHGVMNTDNMSILGLTIDYGPYGWLEGYDAGWTPNTTDAHGRRYCYGNQPQIGMWNLARLAGALLPLIPDQQALHAGLDLYASTFESAHRAGWAAKLGLATLGREGDDEWFGELFEVLALVETDLTLFCRGLARVRFDAAPPDAAARRREWFEPLRAAYYDEPAFSGAHRERLHAWLERYAARAAAEGATDGVRIARMDAVNPRYVPRNWLAQQAIDAATSGDLAPLERLLHVLRRPYDEQPGQEELAQRRPEWARDRPGCSALSCSS